jgi:cytochrome c553
MAFAALSTASALAQPKPDLTVAAKAVSCNACHGPYGRSEAGIPPLAGRDADQMFAALVGFKTGQRGAFVMHHHAKGYSDEELRAMAEYFSKQSAAGVRR